MGLVDVLGCLGVELKRREDNHLRLRDEALRLLDGAGDLPLLQRCVVRPE